MADGQEAVASGQWPVASEGEGQMADGQEEVASGEWRVASEGPEMAGGGAGGDDPVLVSPVGLGVQTPPQTPQKAPNEANLGMTEGTKQQRVKAEKRDSAKRERSQSAASERKVHGGRDDRVETTVPAGEGGGEARGDTSTAGAQAVAENVVPGQQEPPIVAHETRRNAGREVGTVVQPREGMVQTGQPPTSGVNPIPCRMNKAGSASRPRLAASPVRTTG